MTGQQRAVLWIGLILVGLNIAAHWKEIQSVIFNGAGITAGIPGSSDNSNGGLGGILGGSFWRALRGILPGGGGFIAVKPPAKHKSKDVMV